MYAHSDMYGQEEENPEAMLALERRVEARAQAAHESRAAAVAAKWRTRATTRKKKKSKFRASADFRHLQHPDVIAGLKEDELKQWLSLLDRDKFNDWLHHAKDDLGVDLDNRYTEADRVRLCNRLVQMYAEVKEVQENDELLRGEGDDEGLLSHREHTGEPPFAFTARPPTNAGAQDLYTKYATMYGTGLHASQVATAKPRGLAAQAAARLPEEDFSEAVDAEMEERERRRSALIAHSSQLQDLTSTSQEVAELSDIKGRAERRAALLEKVHRLQEQLPGAGGSNPQGPHRGERAESVGEENKRLLSEVAELRAQLAVLKSDYPPAGPYLSATADLTARLAQASMHDEGAEEVPLSFVEIRLEQLQSQLEAGRAGSAHSSPHTSTHSSPALYSDPSPSHHPDPYASLPPKTRSHWEPSAAPYAAAALSFSPHRTSGAHTLERDLGGSGGGFVESDSYEDRIRQHMRVLSEDIDDTSLQPY